MERLIVAFENERDAQRIRDVIETAGIASCILCRSAAEVKRLVRETQLMTVICGFKLPDDSCQSLRNDLPAGCKMLLIAAQSRMELVAGENIFKLVSPVKKSELLDAVEMLFKFQRKAKTGGISRRADEEKCMVAEAKQKLMVRYGMTEEEAHRFLQKQSMDNGAKLADTARMVMENS